MPVHEGVLIHQPSSGSPRERKSDADKGPRAHRTVCARKRGSRHPLLLPTVLDQRVLAQIQRHVERVRRKQRLFELFRIKADVVFVSCDPPRHARELFEEVERMSRERDQGHAFAVLRQVFGG